MMPSSQLHADLPDHANEADDRALAIDKVGIKDLSYPIQILDRKNEVQHTVASVNLSVGLPHHFKGTHMSRFLEILNARRGEMTLRNIPDLLSEIQRRLETDDAHLDLTFPYFISKKAPVSGVESLMEYRCAFRASKHGSDVDFLLSVEVPVKSLCPCSKAISDRGAHNQRSKVRVEVRFSEFIWIEQVAEAVEACASAPLFALLKREDEKYITELAYDNPKFVEDLVRDVVLKVRDLPGVYWLNVTAENLESIHNHSAYAEIEWSSEDTAPDETIPLPASLPGTIPESPHFGPWLRNRRQAHSWSQQAFAKKIKVSPAHLSRVEAGEKRLSEDALRRAAMLLGQEPDLLLLRAGVVPEALLDKIAAHPEDFRTWALTSD